MKEIKIFEQAMTGNLESINETNFNSTMYSAYIRSKENGNAVVDFNDVIWNKDIETIVRLCKENDIKEFTISSTYSSLIEVLAEFEKFGVKMNGLTSVNAPYTDICTGTYKVIPAIKMSL